MIQLNTSKDPHGWMQNQSMKDHESGNLLGFEYLGHLWTSSENLFQALRFGEKYFEKFASCSSGASKVFKKKLLKQNTPTEVELLSVEDVALMVRTIAVKLDAHPYLQQKLMETEGEIVEDCSNRRGGSGLFWGAAQISGTEYWVGYNILGEIYMVLRDMLKYSIPNYLKNLQSPVKALALAKEIMKIKK